MIHLKVFTLLFAYLSLLFVTSAMKNDSNAKVGTKENPGNSCKDILAHGGTDSDTYYIRLSGEVLRVYCDQDTDGGGWTLVLSYTFTNFKAYGEAKNAITPRPNWPIGGETRTSVTPPQSETDFNAMNFYLWREIGNEFMFKSNVNNWVACSEGTGSFVKYVSGSIKCKLVKNVTGFCANIVPNIFLGTPSKYYGPAGPLFFSTKANKKGFKAYYLLESYTSRFYPTHDPCGEDFPKPAAHPALPRGSVYIR